MKKVLCFVAGFLFVVSSVCAAGSRKVFDSTELIDLGKEISKTIENADIKVKPHIQKKKAASEQLLKKIQEMNAVSDPKQKELLKSEAQLHSANVLNETVQALTALENAVSSLTDSFIKINDLLLKGGSEQARRVEKMTEDVSAKMQQMGSFTGQASAATMKFIADPKLQASVFKSLDNVRRRSSNIGTLKNRVKGIKDVTRVKILDALAMQSELQNLITYYKSEAMYNSFCVKLALIDGTVKNAENLL
ncbi:MAG: hypothetical protein ABIH42_03685, partial [Planctomycetota bacterium]